ncbi:MAG: LysM peptidoglycan-binding protein [Bacilli bacterium]|nr:LysM peptidoglycan-binding protein [Bacilli bacterium]
MTNLNVKISTTGMAIAISLLGFAVPAIAKAHLWETPPAVPKAITQEINTQKVNISTLSVRTLTEQNPYLVKTISPKETPSTASDLKTKSKPKAVIVTKAAIVRKAAILTKAISKTNSDSAAPSLKRNTVVIPSGKAVEFKRLVAVKATAYTAAAEENGLWGAFDFFGNPLKTGTIAVDPNVIPLGTTLYITGYSFNGLPSKGMIAKAADTGSAIKGKRIDIFVPTSQANASEFGMQDVKVYILK